VATIIYYAPQATRIRVACFALPGEVSLLQADHVSSEESSKAVLVIYEECLYLGLNRVFVINENASKLSVLILIEPAIFTRYKLLLSSPALR
jgi:hypothetical protein